MTENALLLRTAVSAPLDWSAMCQCLFLRFASAHCASLLRLATLALLLSALPAASMFAQAQSPTAAPAHTPPQIQLFLDLLEDPEVRNWLEQQRNGRTAAAAEQQPEPMMS